MADSPLEFRTLPAEIREPVLPEAADTAASGRHHTSSHAPATDLLRPTMRMPSDHSASQTTELLLSIISRLTKPNVPKPDSYDGDYELSIFKNRFITYANEHGWTPVDQATKISLYLKGKAATLYDKLSAVDKRDISKIWTTFEKYFTPSENEYLAQLDNIRPNNNESTREFCRRLADIYDKANPKSDINQRDRDLKKLLKSHLPKANQTTFAMVTTNMVWEQSVELICSEIAALNHVEPEDSPVKIVSTNTTSTTHNNPQPNVHFESNQVYSTRLPSDNWSDRRDYRNRPAQPRHQSQPRRNYQPYVADRHQNRAASTFDRNQTGRQQQQRPSTSNYIRPTVICARCNGNGHYARDCPAPKPASKVPNK